jgi:hypothetical protein
VILLALLLTSTGPTPAADHTDIPAAYLGHWALDSRYCGEPGAANVTIGARTVDFYERHGFLDLAQLDHAQTPPGFYGSFRWAELLHFSTHALRLEMVGGKLVITEGDDPDAPRSTAAWSRCPA